MKAFREYERPAGERGAAGRPEYREVALWDGHPVDEVFTFDRAWADRMNDADLKQAYVAELSVREAGDWQLLRRRGEWQMLPHRAGSVDLPIRFVLEPGDEPAAEIIAPGGEVLAYVTRGDLAGREIPALEPDETRRLLEWCHMYRIGDRR